MPGCLLLRMSCFLLAPRIRYVQVGEPDEEHYYCQGHDHRPVDTKVRADSQLACVIGGEEWSHGKNGLGVLASSVAQY